MGEPSRKKPRTTSSVDMGLYDFLPPPDPANDAKAKEVAAAKAFSRPKLPPEDRTRVIFLDVDGVLLPVGAVETILVDGVPVPAREVKESDFSPSALGNLRSIVQQTGAVIVLSSEWRRFEKAKASIKTMLMSQDIPVFKECTEFLPTTKELTRDPLLAWCERRAREIGKYLKEHPEVTAWVAIDDLDFAKADRVRSAGTPWIKYRSVLTNQQACITEEDAADAIRLLQYPPPEPKIEKIRRHREHVEDQDKPLLISTEDSLPDRIRLG